GSRCVFPTFPIVLRLFKTLCFYDYALILRQDYDITSSLRRGALQVEISTSVLIKIVSPIKVVLIILMGRKTGRSDLVSNHLRSGRWSWSLGLVFLSKSNALTISLSSATSDEMAGVDELVPTLATTALARD
nr:hypothetical protein [Tanacetum cinerariifolium]